MVTILAVKGLPGPNDQASDIKNFLGAFPRSSDSNAPPIRYSVKSEVKSSSDLFRDIDNLPQTGDTCLFYFTGYGNCDSSACGDVYLQLEQDKVYLKDIVEKLSSQKSFKSYQLFFELCLKDKEVVSPRSFCCKEAEPVPVTRMITLPCCKSFLIAVSGLKSNDDSRKAFSGGHWTKSLAELRKKNPFPVTVILDMLKHKDKDKHSLSQYTLQKDSSDAEWYQSLLQQKPEQPEPEQPLPSGLIESAATAAEQYKSVADKWKKIGKYFGLKEDKLESIRGTDMFSLQKVIEKKMAMTDKYPLSYAELDSAVNYANKY